MADERVDTEGQPINPADSAILRVRFGKNWRWWKWFRDQWTKLSVTVVCALASGIGAMLLWNVHLGTKVVVLETQIVPDLKLAERVSELEKLVSNHDGRIASNERDIGQVQTALGEFDYRHAREEAGKLTLHGKLVEKGKRRNGE